MKIPSKFQYHHSNGDTKLFKPLRIIFVIFEIALGMGFLVSLSLYAAAWRLSGDEAGSNNIFPGSDFSQAKDERPKMVKVKLAAVGDVMLSRSVGEQMRERGDYTYPFLKTAELLKNADITFGNLETPITPGRPVLPGEMSFRADPEVVAGLKFAGFDIVSLANNHTPNYGESGLRDTFSYLDGGSIKYVGAGQDFDEAHRPVVVESNGVRFAFFAYNDSDVVPSVYEASESHPGTALMDITVLQKDVAAIKQEVDFVIVSMHSGTEYAPEPNERQKEFARAAVDAGAALVLGHHPHVVQTAEKYQDGYIFYSLGNFVFDQMWSLETRQGLIAQFTFAKDGIEDIDLTPVIIENYAQPRLATEQESQAILSRLGNIAGIVSPFEW